MVRDQSEALTNAWDKLRKKNEAAWSTRSAGFLLDTTESDSKS